ncbi:MAG TPA: twin-arginine translocase TatA/TatE family subunit [Pyrinomonadaceae bacterium]|nr:twin-arginine translocase TatA/TatE family subunit [Pyrinomonadaceae bacterium]
MLLFIFEGLGTSELLLILIVALVLFGPRKLPQLSRSLGKSLANFKRASEDFKQTWEKEVARESALKEALIGEPMLPEDRSILNENRDRSQAVFEASEDDAATSSTASHQPLVTTADESAVARSSSTPAPVEVSSDVSEVAQPARTRKRDWL